MESMNFEQLNEHIEQADLAQFDNEVSAQDLSGQLTQICNIYRIVKPILNAVLAIPFIPEKGKQIVRKFMAILDQICQ